MVKLVCGETNLVNYVCNEAYVEFVYGEVDGESIYSEAYGKVYLQYGLVYADI
jgi:hypothetical protein